MVKMIGESYGKKVCLTKILNPCIWCLGKIPGKLGILINKVFGNIVYSKQISEYRKNYWINDLRTSILKTESEYE